MWSGSISKSMLGVRSCFLLFAFTHTNAIYTNALYCVRSSSFYKWEEEHGRISYWGQEISISFWSLQWNFKAFVWDFETSKKQDLIPMVLYNGLLLALMTFLGIRSDPIKSIVSSELFWYVLNHVSLDKNTKGLPEANISFQVYL